MATLQRRGDSFRLDFYYGGRRFRQSLQTTNEKTAQGILARAEDILHRVSIGTETIPADADVAAYLISGKKRNAMPTEKAPLTLKQLFDLYFQNIPDGCLETETVEGTLDIHQQMTPRVASRETIFKPSQKRRQFRSQRSNLFGIHANSSRVHGNPQSPFLTPNYQDQLAL
jgi:hypothetical protein